MGYLMGRCWRLRNEQAVPQRKKDAEKSITGGRPGYGNAMQGQKKNLGGVTRKKTGKRRSTVLVAEALV